MRLWLLYVGIGSALLAVSTPAWAVGSPGSAADLAELLVRDLGPAWSPVVCPEHDTASLAEVCFRATTGPSPADFLILSAPVLSTAVDPRVYVSLAPSGDRFPTPGLAVAAGEITPVNDRVAVSIVMVAGDHLFNLLLDSGRSPPEAEATLLDVARRQQAKVGRPRTAPPGSEQASRALDHLLLDPPPSLGLETVGTIDQPSDMAGLKTRARSRAVFDLLAGAPARTRVFAIGGVPVASATLWKESYEVFAAAELGTLNAPSRPPLRIDLHRVPNATAFRLTNGSKHGLAIAFRRGPYLAVLTAPAIGPDEAAAGRALAELARLQAARLPPSPSAPYFFPSATKSVAVTAGVVTLLCGAALGVGPLVSTRRRRRSRSSTEPTSDVADPIGSADVIDVGPAGARLRRRGFTLVSADVVAVNLIVVGSLGATGVLRLPPFVTICLLVAGVVGGVLFTAWFARSEHPAARHGVAIGRELRPSPVGVIGAIVAVSLLVAGLAILASGLANLAFGASLSALRWSHRLGVSPTTLSLGEILGGAILLVAGGFAVRLSRMWNRAGAARLRARDTRPPVLYLRSFEDDALRLPVVVSARRPFLELFAARGSDLFEESIAWQVAPYGPVVAVGRPGRSTRSLGAARELLSEDMWRDDVAERMSGAGAIVVILGATEGLEWEVGRIAADGHLDRCLFVFPPVPADVLAQRWGATRAALRSSLGPSAVPDLPLPADRILVATVEAPLRCRVAVADVRDEATYRAAVDQAMGTVMGAGGPAPSGPDRVPASA